MGKNPMIKVENLPEAPEPTKSGKIPLPPEMNKILHRLSIGRNKRLFKEESNNKANRDMPESRATK